MAPIPSCSSAVRVWRTRAASGEDDPEAGSRDERRHDRHADAAEGSEEVVLRELTVVELPEPSERLRGDDEPDRDVRSGQDEDDDEETLEDADRRADSGREPDRTGLMSGMQLRRRHV